MDLTAETKLSSDIRLPISSGLFSNLALSGARPKRELLLRLLGMRECITRDGVGTEPFLTFKLGFGVLAR